MAASALSAERSPVAAGLQDLIRLKPAGETIRLTTPRIPAFAVGD